jgi:hypothetical protein
MTRKQRETAYLKQLNNILAHQHGITIVNFGRIICAWCKRDLGPYSGEGDTHGICADCKQKILDSI